MKKIRTIDSVICLFMAIAISLSSCKKDDDNSANPIPPSGTTLKTCVVGKITDTDGSVVPGVTCIAWKYHYHNRYPGAFPFQKC